MNQKTNVPMQDCHTNAINSYAIVDRIEKTQNGDSVVLEVENIPTNHRDSLPVECEVPTYTVSVPMEDFKEQQLEQYVREGSVFCVVHDPEVKEVHYIMEHDGDEEQKRLDYVARLEAEIDEGTGDDFS